MLLPTIFIHWQDYQRQILDRLKMLESSLVISGDGRHDSMGHSAKYGAYTVFSCTSQQIIHFSLIQVKNITLNMLIMHSQS
jgi:solute carrier family 8 (sodium/calcium exchanger)